MKVKLLRKVRNRYKITKVEELGTNPSYSYKWGEKNLGLPFLILQDGHDRYRANVYKGDDLDKAKEDLMFWIRKDYAHKIKNKEDKTKTVWYNG